MTLVSVCRRPWCTHVDGILASKVAHQGRNTFFDFGLNWMEQGLGEGSYVTLRSWKGQFISLEVPVHGLHRIEPKRGCHRPRRRMLGWRHSLLSFMLHAFLITCTRHTAGVEGPRGMRNPQEEFPFCLGKSNVETKQ